MKKFTLKIVPLILVVIICSFAHAGNVFLNGVDINTLRDKTFKDATVYIDADGNVHINSALYKVEVVDDEKNQNFLNTSGTDSKTATENASLKNKYYLITQPCPGGKAQYDFEIAINGINRKTIIAGTSQVIMEISGWLHRGNNSIIIKAKKNLSKGRISTSPRDKSAVIIGNGHLNGSIVKIDKVLLSFEVNASQVDLRQSRSSITAN